MQTDRKLLSTKTLVAVAAAILSACASSPSAPGTLSPSSRENMANLKTNTVKSFSTSSELVNLYCYEALYNIDSSKMTLTCSGDEVDSSGTKSSEREFEITASDRPTIDQVQTAVAGLLFNQGIITKDKKDFADYSSGRSLVISFAKATPKKILKITVIH